MLFRSWFVTRSPRNWMRWRKRGCGPCCWDWHGCEGLACWSSATTRACAARSAGGTLCCATGRSGQSHRHLSRYQSARYCKTAPERVARDKGARLIAARPVFVRQRCRQMMSTSAGLPVLTTASARRSAGPTSSGDSIGPSPHMPMLRASAPKSGSGSKISMPT